MLNEIADLEQRLRERDNVVNQKQAQISSLTTQVANLQTQAQSVATSQTWSIVLSNPVRYNVNAPTSSLSFDGVKANLSGWKSYANISNVAGEVIIDLVNKKLTIGGNSYGTITAQ
ncbi:hypothetical protein [Candidatus Tisiphia endosymbiont of Ditula angustiorana]|uniref:hypothetical protein n=1 Tax=Candidatus Tisiphia endosymbiont of Ditula angustiorana TaxID=3066272 RepID=UPI00312C733A